MHHKFGIRKRHKDWKSDRKASKHDWTCDCGWQSHQTKALHLPSPAYRDGDPRNAVKYRWQVQRYQRLKRQDKLEGIASPSFYLKPLIRRHLWYYQIVGELELQTVLKQFQKDRHQVYLGAWYYEQEPHYWGEGPFVFFCFQKRLDGTIFGERLTLPPYKKGGSPTECRAVGVCAYCHRIIHTRAALTLLCRHCTDLIQRGTLSITAIRRKLKKQQLALAPYKAGFKVPLKSTKVPFKNTNAFSELRVNPRK